MPTPSSSTAVGSNNTTTSSSSLASVLPWLRSVKIWWDETLVDIRAGCSNTSGPDLGVFAVKDITENQLLCVIPRSAILSPRTSQLAAILEQERLGGGLALVIAVMYEASLGPDSKWAGYFASLPRREYLPIFWSDAELEMLEGTSLEGRAAGDRQDIQEDYETHVVPLMKKYPQAFTHPGRCTLDDFMVAASWVSSRCFFVDNWHGDAMVPLADIFNHKASVVLLGDAWGVAELADAHEHGHGSDGHELDHEREQGAEGHEHGHGQSSSEAEGEGESDSEAAAADDVDVNEQDSDQDSEDAQHGFQVGGMPIISAGPAATGSNTGRWVRDGLNLRLEIGICSLGPPDSRELPPAPGAAAAAAVAAANGEASASAFDEQPAKKRKVQQQQQEQQQQQQQHQCHDGCHHEQQQQQRESTVQQQWPEKRLEIVAASAVAAGAEIHNTYGELGNAQLVAKYGFCLPQNPFDEIALCGSWSELFILVGKKGPPAKLKKHVEWLQKHSDLLDDVEEGEESPDPPSITPRGRLDRMTAAVVRLLGASSAQLKVWKGLEDVLQNPDSDAEDAPTAVPTSSTAAAAAAGAAAQATAGEARAEGGVENAEEDQAVAQHFESLKISQHDVSWWGRAGLELLAAAVQRRLQRYPASLADDRLALLQQQQQQQLQQQMKDAVAAEHAAAVTAALQLRICEQQALQEVLEAVQQVLSG